MSLFLRPMLNCKPSAVLLTSMRAVSRIWKEERGFPQNPNAYGVLTDGADYTFLDGRPTPYGSHQRRRMQIQKELAKDVIRLAGEIDFALEHHAQRTEQKEEAVRTILDNKLKPKGKLLIKQVKSLG